MLHEFQILGKNMTIFLAVLADVQFLEEITLERIFATYFIADYEQRKRPQISFLILLIVIILNISAAIFTLFAFAFDIVTTICIASPAYIVMALVTIYGYKKLHDYNEKLRTHLSKDHCGIEYNLSLRFQVDENLRALKLLHTLLITLSFLNCLGAIFGVITFAIFDQTSIPAQILGSLFELWIVLYTLFFLFTVLYSVDEWRHHYVDIWRNIFGLQPIEIRPEKRSRDSETTLYFDYYKQNW
ncbi:unnamed protein product, partial [Mesorhabditis belari]|uniref:Uncharacterized protein n=1 Tax=Mesorhabditis belari TaxID=2138241 RepID=A0AAF3FFQ0_9BILA